jgi:hypothetical protein
VVRLACLALTLPSAAEGLTWTEGPHLRCGLDTATSLPAQIETQFDGPSRQWLSGPVRLRVRNEVTGADAAPAITQRWSATASGLVWNLEFDGEAKRVGHEVVLDLPILSPDLDIFTPTDRGVMKLAAYPTFTPPPYGMSGWNGGAYVLPLISLLDPRSNHALTLALPADANIPNLQFAWRDATTLRLTLGHRGMGGGRPSPLTLLLFAHAADYRSALKAYSDAFPAWFKPPLPRGPYEGAFWYHHIQDHPDFAEMARQGVRYVWSSFWFTHLGEYLPAEHEWLPYTYARWWKLGQTMSDDKIRAFVRALHEHGIGTYAYFNVTEYGGAGGASGDDSAAARMLRDKLSEALVKDSTGHAIPSWEGAMVMNPGKAGALWPLLEDQVRRHLTRVPELDGFCIDRLDWAGGLDYGHDDGLSMVGDRAVMNLAQPVGEAVREVARLAHAAGQRVFVNQFYRVEVLRDVDGVCHEDDDLPALGYLTPLRPASAWHRRAPYHGDLLAFEAQLKRRLQWALQPQMVAHQFPISQQAPDARAADLLEIYAPLFETLSGKEQVLLPHCVEVSGPNDANLFRDPAGRYLVPVTSRVRFLSRRSGAEEPIRVTLRFPGAADLTWAHVLSADRAPSRAALAPRDGGLEITVAHHGTATMLVMGRGSEPNLDDAHAMAIAQTRDRLFGRAGAPAPPSEPPALAGVMEQVLFVSGAPLGVDGAVGVEADGQRLGVIPSGRHAAAFVLPGHDLPHVPPTLSLATFDEGTWLVPERLELWARLAGGQVYRVAQWLPGATTPDGGLPLAWCAPELVAGSAARFLARDATSGGQWRGTFGTRAVWMPGMDAPETPRAGFRLKVDDGQAFTWQAAAPTDRRVPQHPKGLVPAAACWFADDLLRLRLVPPDAGPYRLTLYLLDYDRNGRAMEVGLADDLQTLDSRRVTTVETEGGVYLTWLAHGPLSIEVHKLAGFNAVLSAVFVDSAPAN